MQLLINVHVVILYINCSQAPGGTRLLTEDEIQNGVHEMNQKADNDRSGR